MFFGVLGPLLVRDGADAVDAGTPKDRAVLAVLLAHAGRPVRAERLVEAVWGDRAPRGGVRNLQVNVHRLRRALGGRDRIPFADGGYRIVLADGELDAREAEALAAAAARAAPPRAAGLLDRALGLWRGEPFADWPDIALLRPEAARLAELRLELLERRVDAELACGRHGALIAELRALVAAHPLRERFHGQLMLALHRAGRRGDALAAYQDARRVLRAELGLDPGPELRELQRIVLAGDEAGDEAGEDRGAVPAQLPAAVGSFTGRAAALEAISGAVAAGRTTVAVVGSGGVGKTALALHWARGALGRFPDGQLWVDLRGFASAAPLRPEDVVTRFLRALGCPAERIPPEPEEQFALFRGTMAGKRALVLLDNAAGPEQVRPLLTAGPGCVTLVTSRNSLRGLVARDDARTVELGALTAREAAALLRRLLGPRADREAPAVLDELARRCAFLPLALRVAAANIVQGQGHRGVKDYLASLDDREFLDELSLEDDPDAAVRAAFDLSYGALKPDEQRLFRRLGLVPGKDVAVGAAATLTGETAGRVRRRFDLLVSNHLVERRGEDRFQLHDLLRVYAAERAEEEEHATERETARRRLFDYYLHSAHRATEDISLSRARPSDHLPQVRPRSFGHPAEARAWLENELANLLAVVTETAAHGPWHYSWQLVHALEFHLRGTCAYETWTGIAETALAAAARHGTDADVANLHVSMGHACMEAGSYRRALAHGRAAARHGTAGGWPEGTSWGLALAGWAQGCLGETDSAAEALEEGARVAREHGLPRALLACVLHLGDARLHGGRLREAERHYAEVLRETAHGEGDRLLRGLAFLGMGASLRLRGEPGRALLRLRSALALLDSLAVRSGHAEALAARSLAHHDLGDDATALRIAREAVQAAGERHEHGKMPVTLISLAAALERERPGRAHGHYADALGTARSAARPLQEIEALCGLARTALRLGCPDEALARAHEAMALTREDEWLVQTAAARGTLAQVRRDRAGGAENGCEDGFADGPEHPGEPG
ncbi:BTAD domain-containing putative transcriptional regulator [Spirillospora sp. NPDC029432]|uniref:AfsR/SARP family transcriptional regulator n=1 Tax=Spirillospora sp. NPDC029432 TaxID=3154599 RepID=UPI003451D035